MTAAARRLAELRARLLAQSAAQRRRLRLEIEPWRKPIEMLDHGLHLVHVVRTHPMWFAGAGALLLLLRPRGAAAWLRHGWLGWLMFSKLG
jgi:hypothetical protein